MAGALKTFRSAKMPNVALCLMLGALPSPVFSDWIPSSLDQRCDPSDIDGISNSIRDAIEASVRRAEASIEPPAGIGDLGCLDGLMQAPIDIFSNIGGILGTLQQGLFSSLSFPVDFNASGMLCEFAAAKWGELTQGLGNMNVDLAQFASTPSDLVGRLAGGGGFGSGSNSTPSSGTLPSSFTTSSGDAPTNQATGTDRTQIPIGSDTAGLPIFPDTGMPVSDDDNIDMVSFQNAYNSWLSERDVALARFTACEVARAISTTTGWIGSYPRPCAVPELPPEPRIENYQISSTSSFQRQSFSAAPVTVTPQASSSATSSTESATASDPILPGSLIQQPATEGPARDQTSTTSTIDSIWGQF